MLATAPTAGTTKAVTSRSIDLSYADADLAHVRGHRQVSDAYLAALARHHGVHLATLDHALAAAIPGGWSSSPRSAPDNAGAEV